MAEVSWHCVGLIKVGEGPVKAISLANGGNKIATAITTFDGMIVNIWDAETYLVDGNFILEDRISPSGRVTVGLVCCRQCPVTVGSCHAK
jgi:hypothetical protein